MSPGVKINPKRWVKSMLGKGEASTGTTPTPVPASSHRTTQPGFPTSRQPTATVPTLPASQPQGGPPRGLRHAKKFLDATLGRRAKASAPPPVVPDSAQLALVPEDSQPAPPQDTQLPRQSTAGSTRLPPTGREVRHTYAGLTSREDLSASSSRPPEIHIEPASDSESDPHGGSDTRPRALRRRSANQSLRNRLEGMPLMANQPSPLSSNENFLLDVPSPWSSQGSLRNKRSTVSASSSVDDVAGLDALVDPAFRQMSLAEMMSQESLPASDSTLSPRPSYEDLRPMSPWQSFDEPERVPRARDSSPTLERRDPSPVSTAPTQPLEPASPATAQATPTPKSKAKKLDEPVVPQKDPDPFDDALFDDLPPAVEEVVEPSVAGQLESLRGEPLVPKDSMKPEDVLKKNRDKLAADLRKLGASTAEDDKPVISLINPKDKITALAVPASGRISNKATRPGSVPSSSAMTTQRNPWTLKGSPAQQALFDQVVALTTGRNLSDNKPLEAVDALLPQVRELFAHCVKVKDFSSAAILAGMHLLPRMGGLAQLNDAGRALQQKIDRFRDGLSKEAKVILGLGEAAFLDAQGRTVEAIATCRKAFDGAVVLKTVSDHETRVGSRISFVSSIDHRTLAHALETRLALRFGLTGPQRLRYSTQLEELKASYPDLTPPALSALQTPTVSAEASGNRSSPTGIAVAQPSESMDAGQNLLYARLKTLSEGRQLGVGAPADIPELDGLQDQAMGLFHHLVQAGDGDRAAKLAGWLLLPRMGAQNRTGGAQALIKDLAPLRPQLDPGAQVILALGEASFLLSQARPGNGLEEAAMRRIERFANASTLGNLHDLEARTHALRLRSSMGPPLSETGRVRLALQLAKSLCQQGQVGEARALVARASRAVLAHGLLPESLRCIEVEADIAEVEGLGPPGPASANSTGKAVTLCHTYVQRLRETARQRLQSAPADTHPALKAEFEQERQNVEARLVRLKARMSDTAYRGYAMRATNGDAELARLAGTHEAE